MKKVELSLPEKLQRFQEKRTEKYRNERVVYAYRFKGSPTFTDNLLLLPRDLELGHRDFLFDRFSSFPLDQLKSFEDVSVYRIGYFNVYTLSFKRCSERRIFDISEVIDFVRKVSTK